MFKKLLIIIAVLQLSIMAHASEPISVQFGLTGFKPYSIIDPITDSCTGPAFDITNVLLQPFNIKIRAACADPARLYREFSKGAVDMSLNIKSTEALQGKATFTRIPFDLLVLNFYTNNESGAGNNKIAAVRGYGYSGYRDSLLKEGYEIVDVPSIEDAIRLFMNKRTQYLLSYSGPFIDYIENVETSDGTLSAANIETQMLIGTPTHYAISKTSEHHDILVEAFKKIDSQTSKQYHYEKPSSATDD